MLASFNVLVRSRSYDNGKSTSKITLFYLDKCSCLPPLYFITKSVCQRFTLATISMGIISLSQCITWNPNYIVLEGTPFIEFLEVVDLRSGAPPCNGHLDWLDLRVYFAWMFFMA